MADQPLQPPPGIVTRRQFLYMSGGTIAALTAGGILAACSSAATSAPTPAPTAAPTAAPTTAATVAPTAAAACPSPIANTAAVGGPLNLFEWEGYDGKGLPVWDAWYKSNNIQVNAKYISTESIPAFMKSPSGKDWDASSLNQGDVQYGWSQGICTPITEDDVPALKKMYAYFKDSPLWKVCDGVYAAVPWSWGPIAIVTRPDHVPDSALASYEGLFDAQWKGKIGTFDDALNMVSTAAIANGIDPSFITREQLNGPIKDWLVRLKPQLKVYATSVGDQANVLASGDVWIMLVGWTYFIPSLASQNVKVDFVVPKEGAFGFADSIFIPPAAPHRQNAIAWLNAMMEGETAVAINESTVQLSSNPEVNAALSAETKALYPADIEGYLGQTKFNVSYYDPNGPYSTLEEWTKLWNDIKAGV